jgi:FKBP-type peptidyl-prolyl cis-trans isomerase SlyD
MQISENTVVSIHYTLKNSQGDILDSSSDAEPLTYLHGAGNIIPGLENELSGKSLGDKLEVEVEPDLAYGQRRDELIQKVPRQQFEGIDDLQTGMRFHAQSDNGIQVITVTEIEEEQVTVDANHPLAGEKLFFAVEITDLREATEAEIEHGHVHQDGQHEH